MEKSTKSKTGGGALGSSMNNSTSGAGHQASQNSAFDKTFIRKVVYVAPDKELISLTEHRHKTGGTTIPKQTQEIILHSGECNWRFKFKLVGIERLDVIFNEI